MQEAAIIFRTGHQVLLQLVHLCTDLAADLDLGLQQ